MRDRNSITATCCVLLNPVEFVRELLPAYSPEVVVKLPPMRERDITVSYRNAKHTGIKSNEALFATDVILRKISVI